MRALPATAAALAVGAVSVDHACVVAKTMTALPVGVGIEQARVAESDLAGYAAQFDPVTVGRLGRYLIHLLDSDTMEEREQRAYRRRELRMVDLGDGLRVSVMPVQAGNRRSHRPRLTSAAAARKTSRTRYSSPRQRRNDQALPRCPIDCSYRRAGRTRARQAGQAAGPGCRRPRSRRWRPSAQPGGRTARPG